MLISHLTQFWKYVYQLESENLTYFEDIIAKIVLQTEKIELETTVVDETKERESCCGQNRRFSG